MFSSRLCPEVEITSSHLCYAMQRERSPCYWLAVGLVSLLENTKWLCCGLAQTIKCEVQQDEKSRHLAGIFGQQPRQNFITFCGLSEKNS